MVLHLRAVQSGDEVAQGVGAEDDDGHGDGFVAELGVGEGLPLPRGGLACVEARVEADSSLADENALVARGQDFDVVGRPRW